MLPNHQILLIDEHSARCQKLAAVLETLGKSVFICHFAEWQTQALALKNDLAAIFVDASFPQLDKQLHDLTRQFPFIPIVLLCDAPEQVRYFQQQQQNNRQFAAYLTEPLKHEALVDALYCSQSLLQQNFSRAADSGLLRNLGGSSAAIQKVRELIVQVADKDVSVLIQGESGTGKEAVARHLHELSERAQRSFIPISCSAIPAELLESELFGYEQGAFTGAINARAGRFELAEGGTLFLDEIGDMPLSIQVKLLRVLQDQTFERMGSNKTLRANVRIVAATHKNLEEMIAEGSFREDLYFRLNVFPIEMPALRERIEDVPALMNELVLRMQQENRGVVRFNSEAIHLLCQYSWPGNVRELANLVERMAIVQPNAVVGVEELPVKFRAQSEQTPAAEESLNAKTVLLANEPTTFLLPKEGLDLREYLQDLECSLIKQALDDTNGVVVRAAEKLSIRRTTLVEKIRKYGLSK